MKKLFTILREVLIFAGFILISYFVPILYNLSELRHGQSGAAWIFFLFFTFLICITVVYLSMSVKEGNKSARERLLEAMLLGVYIEGFAFFSLLGALYGKEGEMASWSFILMAIWVFFGFAGFAYLISRTDKSKSNDISYLEALKGAGIIFSFALILALVKILVEKIRGII